MPRISAFFGIVMRMFYNDHFPPHFHAEYSEYEALYAIETLETMEAISLGELTRWSWNGQLFIAPS